MNQTMNQALPDAIANVAQEPRQQTLHKSAFEYLKPTDKQMARMAIIRTQVAILAGEMGASIPDGPDKTYLLRKLREVAMWANVAITRHPDGTPRTD